LSGKPAILLIPFNTGILLKAKTKIKIMKMMMKTKIATFMALILMMGGGNLFAQDKTTEFKVKGNCGMCEKRIETAANSVEGVQSADWNQETKMLSLSYDASKVKPDDVQMAIAKVGHDAGTHKAENEVYDKLPACCKYDRTETTDKSKEGHEGHNH
jgi:periplasmic mercuric ion binding protein